MATARMQGPAVEVPTIQPSTSFHEERPTAEERAAKRPRTANMYMNYCKQWRSQVKAEMMASKGLPEGSWLDSKEVSSELGRRWGLLSANQQKEYK